jgi:hypothetical protein
MARYTISPGSDQDCFDVAIVGDDGARQTLLGFETRAVAEAWIVEDERRSNAEIEGNFRMQWRF